MSTMQMMFFVPQNGDPMQAVPYKEDPFPSTQENVLSKIMNVVSFVDTEATKPNEHFPPFKGDLYVVAF